MKLATLYLLENVIPAIGRAGVNRLLVISFWLNKSAQVMIVLPRMKDDLIPLFDRAPVRRSGGLVRPTRGNY
jgi:hypothetical protein